jgi:hypothetical protein
MAKKRPGALGLVLGPATVESWRVEASTQARGKSRG